ncbi:MAG: DUF5666 domain-containing protein [Candidatus Shapirobacteria bacterium]|jgi:hypothetical protein
MKSLIFLLSFLFFSSQLALAQTPTTSTATEIQQLREVIQQKVQEKLQQISQNPIENPKKAYFGTITQFDATSLKINTKTQNLTFIIDTTTTYINLKQNKIKNTDLKVGQNVLVLTLKQDASTIIAKRIILIDPQKLQNQKITVIGKIADISTTSSVLTLIPINNKSQELQIKLDSKTEILDLNNKTLKTINLKKGQKIICTYGTSVNSTYPALQIIKVADN